MEEYKRLIKDTFNTVSSKYDSLKFFKTSAARMVEFINLKGNESLIDIAAGTGNVTLEAAKRLINGKVLAIDISDKMLQKIKEKAELNNLTNINYCEADFEQFSSSEKFDIAACAFGIFFISDMQGGIKQIAGNIKSGGTICITSFNENFLSQLKALFYSRLKDYGVEQGPGPWDNINTVSKVSGILKTSGLTNIEIIKEQHGYYLTSASDWWNVIMNAGMRRSLTALDEKNLNQFKKEHLNEISKLAEDEGIWMDIEVIFAKGNKE